MAPPHMFDISAIDLHGCVYDTQAINQVNPHRGEMRMLDRIIWSDDNHCRVVAAKEIGEQEFWVEGHFPGRPIFPGVLMVEAAGQLASFQYHMHVPDSKQSLIGFAGVDAVKFRGNVAPSDTFVLLSELTEVRSRRIKSHAQGCVNGTIVFEAQITGMHV